jgi:hypothetical protein
MNTALSLNGSVCPKRNECAGGGKKRRMNSLDKIIIRFFSAVTMVVDNSVIRGFQNSKV